MRRPPREVTWKTRFEDWLNAPQPIERLAIIRIVLRWWCWRSCRRGWFTPTTG